MTGLVGISSHGTLPTNGDFDAVAYGKAQTLETGQVDIIGPGGSIKAQNHAKFAFVVLEGYCSNQCAAQPESAATGECGQQAACAAIH